MIRVTPNWGSVVQPARYNSTRPDHFHQAQILIGSLDWNLFNSLWHRDMMCSPPDVRKGSLTPPAPTPPRLFVSQPWLDVSPSDKNMHYWFFWKDLSLSQTSWDALWGHAAFAGKKDSERHNAKGKSFDNVSGKKCHFKCNDFGEKKKKERQQY